MSDAYDRLVALRPPVMDEADWATSVAGRAALARVHAAAPKAPWWRRRWVVVPTLVIGLAGAAGAGAAFAPADRTPEAEAVVCLGTTPGGDQSLMGIEAVPGDAHALIVAQCNEALVASGNPAAVDFAECVIPPDRNQVGGAEIAVPSNVTVTRANAAAICQAAGFDPAG